MDRERFQLLAGILKERSSGFRDAPVSILAIHSEILELRHETQKFINLLPPELRKPNQYQNDRPGAIMATHRALNNAANFLTNAVKRRQADSHPVTESVTPQQILTWFDQMVPRLKAVQAKLDRLLQIGGMDKNDTWAVGQAHGQIAGLIEEQLPRLLNGPRRAPKPRPYSLHDLKNDLKWW